jgi:hypothetical protein
MFRVFRRKGRRNFSAVKTCWRRECDSNSHYRFEFRNPRRLPNLQAVQHLTRESTGSDWPLGRQKTAHLFLRSSRRTAYDSVAESGHLGALAKGRHWVRNDYLLGRSVRFPLSELTRRQINRDSQRFLLMLFRITSASWPENGVSTCAIVSELSFEGNRDYISYADLSVPIS